MKKSNIFASKYVKLFELFISIAITIAFIYIFYKVIGFKTFFRFLKEISPLNILIAFSLYLLSYITRTLRWKITLEIKDFGKLFKITAFNTIFNIFLPFRTGEFSFFYMLKKENIPFKDSAISFIVVRLFDAISLFTIFFASLLVYKKLYLLALLILIISPFSIYLLKTISKFIKVKKIQEFNKEVLTIKNILILYLLSIGTFFLKFTSFYFVLPQGVKLSFIESFFASASGDITTILPIHGLAGIGTYEAGFVGILVFMGVDKELALLSAVFIHLFILLGSASVGLIALAIRK